MTFPAPQRQEWRQTPTGMDVLADVWDLPRARMDVDPRPDLIDDSMSWPCVLQVATGPVAALLHGLRCYGATLRWSEMGRLHLEWRDVVPRVSGHSEHRILNEWLKPLTNEISAVFRRVESGE